MTITAPTVTVPAGRRDPTRSHARAAGIFYLLTFVSSIPALILLGPILDNANYVTGAGQDTRVLWGCLLDTVNALTAVGSAVAVYSVVKRQNGSMALGFVTSRLIEAAVDHDRRRQPARRRHHAAGLRRLGRRRLHR